MLDGWMVDGCWMDENSEKPGGIIGGLIGNLVFFRPSS